MDLGRRIPRCRGSRRRAQRLPWLDHELATQEAHDRSRERDDDGPSPALRALESRQPPPARPQTGREDAAIPNEVPILVVVAGELFWPPPILSEGANETRANPTNALLTLLLVWTFAAFGQEFSYRGYILSRFATAGGGSAACWVGVVAVAVLFGFGHYYKGPTGIVDSGFAGLILGRRTCCPAGSSGPPSWLTD
jgi:Type II CAAX prenyl endopeptidase Rce1-like